MDGILISMKEVTLGGKTYIRTAAAAKQFGYSQDYLGQLSREGRIAAKRVGRTWFVNPDSIAAYQDELEAESTSTERTGSEAAKEAKKTDSGHVTMKTDNRAHKVSVHAAVAVAPRIKVIRDEETKDKKTNHVSAKESISDKNQSSARAQINNELIEPVSGSKTKSRKSPQKNSSQQKNSAIRKNISSRHTDRPRWYQIAYEADTTELHPKPQKPVKPEKEPAANATPEVAAPDVPSRSLRVHSSSDRYSIVPSQLPSVRLRGQILVSGGDEVKTMPSLKQTRQQIAALTKQGVSTKSNAPAQKTISSSHVPKPAHEPTPVHTKQTTASTSTQSPFWFTRLLYSRLLRTWLAFLLAIAFFLFVFYVFMSIRVVTTADVVADTTRTSWQLVPLSWDELSAILRLFW